MKKLILASAILKNIATQAGSRQLLSPWCRQLFILLTAVVMAPPTFSFAQTGSWLPKANVGGLGRSNAVGFAIGAYGYIGTGYAGTPQNDLWRYNPSNNQWTQMAALTGAARQGATGFAIGNFGYIGTGNNANIYYNDFWKYDPLGNSWTPVANFPGTAREFAAAFSIGTKGYVGAGLNLTSAFNDFYEYNSVTDTWALITAAPFTVRADMFGFAVNGKGYVGCGRDFNGSTFYNTMYEYDTTGSGIWTAKANFPGTPSAREGVSAFVLGNFGFAGLGSTNSFNTQYTDFYKYNPASNIWTAIATFAGTARSNASSFSVGNYGYAGTGYSFGNFTISFYQYDMCGITLTAAFTNVSCNGGSNGSATVTPTNGTAPYTYLWNPTNQTTQTATGLPAGNYTVTVTDAIACTKSQTVTITQPSPLTGTVAAVTNVSCFSFCNGSITVTASGGTPGYSYLWTNGSSTSIITGLCAGNYSATITDANGCTTILSAAITQPPVLTGTITSTNASKACLCNGSAAVNVSGGTPAYTYQWCNGASTSAINGLCPGATCSITVYDNKGCMLTNAVVINPVPLTLSLTATPATCPSCPNGSATANPSGGNAPYLYQWTNGQTTQTATGLTPAYYPVCITDADTCQKCDSIYVGWAIGVNEINSSDFLIVPNPSTGMFTVFFNTQYSISNTQIEIHNVYGEKVAGLLSDRVNELNPTTQQLNNSITLNLSSHPNGIYFLQIKTEQGIENKKLIINK